MLALDVLLPIASQGKALQTHRTLKVFLATVGDHVLIEIITLIELFPAHRALVGPLTRMDENMTSEVGLLAKRLAASVTAERARIGVSAVVLLQCALVAEAFAAKVALVGSPRGPACRRTAARRGTQEKLGLLGGKKCPTAVQNALEYKEY